MCKAVIFDMDGLMIDSERVTFKWYKEYMRQCGMDMPEEFYKTLLGQTKAECKQKLIKTYGNDFPYEESVDWVHKKMQEEFENDGIDYMQIEGNGIEHPIFRVGNVESN